MEYPCKCFLRTFGYLRGVGWYSHSKRRYQPVSQRLVRQTMLKKFIFCAKFYSHTTASIPATIDQMTKTEGRNNMPSNVEAVLNELDEAVKSDDFTEIVFNPILDDCIRLLPRMKEKEYVKLIDILSVIKSKFGSLYDCDDKIIHISEQLDPILQGWLRRYPREEIPRLLKFSEVLVGRPSFTFDVIKEVKRALTWPTALMLRFIEHMNKGNLWRVYYVHKYNVEYAFLKHYPHLDINEAAILLQAMIHLKMTLITPELPKMLFELFLDKHRSAELQTVTIFLKFFTQLDHCFRNDRYNVNSLLPSIVRVVNEHVNLWPLSAIIHAASFFKKIVCYDPSFFENLVRRMILDDVLRLKVDEIDEFFMAVVFFDAQGRYDVELRQLIEKLKTDSMYSILRYHPKRLVNIMYSVSKVGIYDEYFFDIIMSKGFLLDVYKKLDPHYIPFKVYSLNKNAEIEYSNHLRKRLDEGLNQEFEKLWGSKLPELFSPQLLNEKDNYFKYSTKRTAHQDLIYEMRPVLESLLGKSCFLLNATYPQVSRLNFIFALKDGRPKELDEVIRQSHHLAPEMLDNEYSWYAFMFLTPNALPPHELLLLHNYITESRLLAKMGVDLIPFVAKNWRKMDDYRRIEHLKHLIFRKS